MDLLITLFYIVFVISAIVLIVVILLQEGKGGGFGQALGDHGQQTFGVGAKGINTFTGYTAGIFLFSAILLHILNRQQETGSVLQGGAAPGGSVLEQPLPTGSPTPAGNSGGSGTGNSGGSGNTGSGGD